METFTDDTVVALASFLAPHDMLSLALTCKRFGAKHGTTTSRSRRLAAREANKSRGIREAVLVYCTLHIKQRNYHLKTL